MSQGQFLFVPETVPPKMFMFIGFFLARLVVGATTSEPRTTCSKRNRLGRQEAKGGGNEAEARMGRIRTGQREGVNFNGFFS